MNESPAVYVAASWLAAAVITHNGLLAYIVAGAFTALVVVAHLIP